MAQRSKLLFSAPKRNFNEKIDRALSNLINKLPNGNIGYLFVGVNTAFYLAYLLWPRHQLYSFMNNFTFSNYNLTSGRLHTLFTCHFTHLGFFSYLIDSAILYLFCMNLQTMHGPLYIAKLSILAMVLSSGLMLL